MQLVETLYNLWHSLPGTFYERTQVFERYLAKRYSGEGLVTARKCVQNYVALKIIEFCGYEDETYRYKVLWLPLDSLSILELGKWLPYEVYQSHGLPGLYTWLSSTERGEATRSILYNLFSTHAPENEGDWDLTTLHKDMMYELYALRKTCESLCI